jgi:ABC-2 type transport system permease protein
LNKQKLYYHWIIGVALVLLLNSAFSFLHTGVDLTEDKRYTLTASSLDYVKNISTPLELTVYLEGEMPMGFKRLASAAENIATSYNRISNGKFSIKFEKPGEGLSDSLKAVLYDSLQKIGIHPTNVKAQGDDQDQLQETLIFPGAVLSSPTGQIGIDFIEGQNSMDGLTALNNAASQMEYKITKAIKVLTRDTFPLIGYLTGNDEPLDYSVYDLIENVVKKEYRFSILPIDSISFIPADFQIILINQPHQSFKEQQKLMIDQYIMHGGKVIWALDYLFASMDSLQKSNGSFVAFDMGLNLDDQLFKYGVRINRDLVQDLESDQVPSIVGNMGGKPQIQLLPWPYAPLVRDRGYHPISRNLDKVLTSFPQSIDTVSVKGVSTAVLLSSSEYGRKLPTPALVEWKSIKSEGDLKDFTTAHIPTAVLLEGNFSSAYKNRISGEQASVWMKNTGSQFLEAANNSTEMIVISDGDIFLNPVSDSDGPLAMGSNRYTRIQYANKEFLKNCLFYLSDGKELLASRAKNFQLRLLNKEILKEDKSIWRWINLLGPLLLPLLISFLVKFYRKRKYSSPLL